MFTNEITNRHSNIKRDQKKIDENTRRNDYFKQWRNAAANERGERTSPNQKRENVARYASVSVALARLNQKVH